MLRPSAAARGAAAERGRGGAPAAQPARNWVIWRGGNGARLADGAWGGTRGKLRRLRALGLVRRAAGPASSVRTEQRERERGPEKAVGGRGAGSRGWSGKEEGASRRKEETMKRRNDMNTGYNGPPAYPQT